MKLNSVILVGTALTFAACGRDNEVSDADVANASMNGALNESAAAPLAPTTAQAFANVAAASDRFEIESSNLAATAGQSAAIKSFAAQMLKAHTASAVKLKSTVTSLNPRLTLNDALSATQQQMLEGLKGKTGADFDAAYAASQVEAHQASLNALNAYASSGDNAALQELAEGLAPTVTAHLNMAKGLK